MTVRTVQWVEPSKAALLIREPGLKKLRVSAVQVGTPNGRFIAWLRWKARRGSRQMIWPRRQQGASAAGQERGQGPA